MNRSRSTIFRTNLDYRTIKFIFYPSNIATPSAQDIEITQQLIQAGKIIGINVLDHVIITKCTYISINAQY